MKKMNILLSGRTNLQYYEQALEGVGAEPHAEYLPPVDTGHDGLILCGGVDLDPQHYGQPMAGSVDIDAQRDAREFELLKAYIEAGKPVFGICRGYQLINVYFGGTMFQDIPETAIHRSGKDFYAAHAVSAAPDSIVGRLHGERFFVNSAHHQAVDALGRGLRATAWWNGQYIEAIEHESLPIFGVQWHPERMCFGQRREDTVDGKEIFLHFVQMCQKKEA